jgi:hypothetical protein
MGLCRRSLEDWTPVTDLVVKTAFANIADVQFTYSVLYKLPSIHMNFRALVEATTGMKRDA